MDEGGKKIVLKESRKSFILIYALTTLFIAGVIFFIRRGYTFNGRNAMIISVVAILGLLIPEILRSWETCTIKSDKIYITSGIIKKRHRKFFTSTITDIHYRQSLWQRIINFGTIEVNLFSQNIPIHLGTVSRPKRCVEEIEEFIQASHRQKKE